MTDTRPWRLYREIHLYAVEPGGTEDPIGTVHNTYYAKQIVNEHNSEIAKVLEENDRLRADARKTVDYINKIAADRDTAREAMARSSTAQARLVNKNDGLIRKLGEVADERDELVSENGKLILKLNEVTQERDSALRVMRSVFKGNIKADEAVWVNGTDEEARCD